MKRNGRICQILGFSGSLLAPRPAGSRVSYTRANWITRNAPRATTTCYGRLNSVIEAGNRKGKGWLPKPGSVFFLEGYRIINGTIYKSGVKNWENYEIKSIYNVHMYKQEPHQANHTTHYIIHLIHLSFNEYIIDIPDNVKWFNNSHNTVPPVIGSKCMEIAPSTCITLSRFIVGACHRKKMRAC